MRPSVYIETSVIGYLAMRPSAHLVTAANQQVTREFWEDHRSRFDLFVSLAVVDECMAGDAEAATQRDVLLQGIPVLGVNDDVLSLAQALMTGIPLPEKADVDGDCSNITGGLAAFAWRGPRYVERIALTRNYCLNAPLPPLSFARAMREKTCRSVQH